jgi:hypothetical protein
MSTKRDLGSKSATVRSLVSTMKRQGYISDPEANRGFLVVLEEELKANKVSRTMTADMLDLFQGIRTPEPTNDIFVDPEVQNGEDVSLNDYGSLGDIGDISVRKESFEGRPMAKAVRDYLTKIDFGGKDHKVHALCVPVTLCGKPTILLATWRLEGTDKSFRWNLTGKITSPTGVEEMLHKCGEDILVFEGGRAVCISSNFSWDDYKVPENFQHTASKWSGTRQAVRGAWFVWALHKPDEKNPVMYRFWLNEEIGGMKGDLVKRRIDLRLVK